MHGDEGSLKDSAITSPLTSAERSALHLRWRPLVPLGLALLALLSLLVVDLWIERRMGVLFDEQSNVAEPASALLTDIELALALEVAGARGFVLTGDTAFAASHREAQARRHAAEAQLFPLARRLGPRVVADVTHLTEGPRQADFVLDSLYEKRLSRSTYLTRLDRQQARLTAAIAAADRLETMLERLTAAHRIEVRDTQRLGSIVSYALILVVLASGLLLTSLGNTFRSTALRLDARERQQSALADVSRRLNAPISGRDATEIVAGGTLGATSAIGAVVELAHGDAAASEMYVATALPGEPPRLSAGDQHRSLTNALAESAEAGVGERVAIAQIGERMAIRPSDGGPELQAIVVPVRSDHRVRGAVGILRPRTDADTAQAETSYLHALADLAASTLHRIELSEALVASEERFRQVADNIHAFVWLRDPVSLRYLYVNAAYETISGRPRERLYHNPASWRDDVHPDDRDRVIATLEGSHDAEYEIEYRIKRPDGTIRWVWARGFPVRNERGEIYRTAGITEDITEQKHNEAVRQQLLAREQAARRTSEEAQAAAERRREELEEVTESRARLMRGFTHDVKNPLGAAEGFLALLEENVLGDIAAQQRDAIVRARRSIHSALALIGRALDLARAEAGQLDLRSVLVDTRGIVEEVIAEHQAEAEAKKVDMATRLPGEPLMVLSDPLRIRQVIGNLISNAIKYTASGGRVDVTASTGSGRDAPAGGDWIVVDVVDTGSGIAPEKVEKVFDEFARFAPDAAGGSGIGLAISQRVARALGGVITVESTLGVGSRFSLWLPAAQRRDEAIQ